MISMLFSDLTSYVFNLVVFSALASVISVLFLNLKGFFSKKALYTIFTSLGAFALLTQLSYVHAPRRIFSNASHHVIEHIGFDFQKTLQLADQSQPQKALWDSKKGKLKAELTTDTSFVLNGENFFEPVFVSDKDDNFHLANPIIRRPVRSLLTIRLNDSLALDFYIHPSDFKNKDESYSFKAHVNGKMYGPFVCVQKDLRTGYSLAGLLTEAHADFPAMEIFTEKLENSWIIRSVFQAGRPLDDLQNPLYFFPSMMLTDPGVSMFIDGNRVGSLKNVLLQIPIKNKAGRKQQFYLGLWTTQTKVYTLNCSDAERGHCALQVVFSEKKPLKKLENAQESLFITSSSDELADSDLTAGFYYPLFVQEQNVNHFSATLAYDEGSTLERMKFHLVSTHQNDLLSDRNRLYSAGDTLRLQIGGGEQKNGGQAVLFKITDLKADNPLQYGHLVVFTLWLSLCICISIFVTAAEKITKTEVIAYVLLLLLLTVRSILLWRISTFPPLDNISPKVFQKMTEAGLLHFIRGALATTFFFIALWSCKLWGQGMMAKFSSFKTVIIQMVFEKKILVLSPYLFAVMLRFVAQAERISAVFMPLIAFFTAELVVLILKENRVKRADDKSSLKVLSALNWVVCFLYLVASDAGFSIVFVMSSLLYWLISLLVFPDRHTASKNAGSYRHWLFLAPFTFLLGILFFSPYLISYVFRHVNQALQVLCVVLVLGALYLTFRKSGSEKENPWLRRLAGFLLIGFAFLLWIFGENISQKLAEKSYIQYRAEVLIHSADQLLKQEQFRFSLGNDSRLLRAAQNQWLINHYYQKGNFGLYDYFRLLPSFQRGSPYMTQISDLVTVRYLIGEHSQFVVIQMLFVMIVLIFSALSADTRFNLYSKIRVQILCMLFMVGFFIWMAATNRMVFLGQDFPLLSLNSTLTLLFSFTILLAAIVLGQLANRSTDHYVVFNSFGRKLGYQLARVLLAGGVLLIWFRNYDLNVQRFDLDATVSELQVSLLGVNDLFADFQRQRHSVKAENADSLSRLLADFDKHILPQKDSLFKSTFSRSAYEAYQGSLSRHNNSANLMHLRKGIDGTYWFAVNKLFYNVYSPDLGSQSWQGNIFGAQSGGLHILQSNDGKKEFLMDANHMDSDLGEKLRQDWMTEIGQNIRLTIIPASWRPEGTPAVLISKTRGSLHENRADFLVKNGVDIFRSSAVDQAMILKPNDVIQFVARGEKRVVSVRYLDRTTSYLAKNVWLNGGRQFYYPLQEKFLWSYHFTNLVKNKFDKQPEFLKRNLQLTIDQRLTAQIYQMADNYFAKTKWMNSKDNENARAFNLVILDEKGSIKALCDYKKADNIKIDPNRMAAYSGQLESRYLTTDLNDERALFGNRCLMRMDNGPASTFKPILYSAVTASYNLEWEKLRFGGLPKESLEGNAGNDYVIRQFGGKRGLRFTVPANNLVAHDLNYYLSHSTNTYNSMIVFLGSLQRAEIQSVHHYFNQDGLEPTFLTRGPQLDQQNRFPNFEYENQNYFISRFPSWTSSKSLMAKGLWENFGLPTRFEQLKGKAGAHLQNIAFDLDSTGFESAQSSYKLWSFPEPSHLYMIDRNDLHTAVVQIATGSAPIYVTPLKMAEMAGKLFSFNLDYKASVIENRFRNYTPLRADVSWGSAPELSGFYSQHLFKAMNAALTGSGTASGLIGKVLQSEFGQYYCYAKTGTISGNREGGKRDKHLMLVISKNKIHGSEFSPQYLKNNKFYVLYFSFYKNAGDDGNWGGEATALLQQMVRTVLGSPGFKSHME